ncbi:fibronectin type III domain-containing protein [Microbispora bryophytorum]|uniref:fibronectin type III domain-containing protein n=1 Tax=Microbispora bryophytorum TaxID=1460882 RepID=UPI0034081FBC
MQVIVPGKPAKLALRLVAYAPNGPRLGVLPQHNGFDVAAPLNDVPGLKVAYVAGGVRANVLADHCEVAVEYAVDGGGWTEPPNARFLRIKRGGDEIDRTGARSYDCPGWAWMLRKVVLYPNGSLVDGKRQFNAVSPGAILATFAQEGQGRGALPGLSYDFSASHDSAGDPWTHTLTLALEPGKDLLTILINLGEQGVIDWRMSGRTLQAFNPDTVLGADRASGPSPVDLRFGRDVTDAPDTGTLEDAASAILIQGDAGLSVEATNPAAVAPWGRWETYQSQGGVTDSGTALLLAQNALERVGRERVQITRGLMFDTARWVPFAHYQPGDYLLAPGDGGVMQSLRLRQITLTVDKDGSLSGNVVLNDRFLEREVRLARQAAGILDGGVSSGGSGGDPAPESNNRVPAAPDGLIVDPIAYIDEAGYPRGQVTATWAPVMADVAGVALDIDGYELYARINITGAPWTQIAAADGTTVSYSPLVVSTAYAFKVRATSAGVKGEFSGQVVKLIPDDVTPPPVPSAPQVASRLGILHVTWDGLGAGGEPMPSDFAALRVWMQDPLAPAPAVVGLLDAAGTLVVPGQPYGADREFWLTSIDRSGNESDESVHAVAATQPLVDTDLIGQVIDGAEHIIDGSIPAEAKITAGTITGGLIQAGAIEAGHLSANAVTADSIEAGAIKAAHIAANAITADKLSATAIDGKTITGSWIRTAASGRRLEMAPPDATTPELRFYPSSGGNYTVLKSRDDVYTGEALLEITTSQSSNSSYRARLQMGAARTVLEQLNASASASRGGYLDISTDYAAYGYYAGSTNSECFIEFNGSGRWVVRGRYWDQADADPFDAILAGSFSVGTALWAIYSYGTTDAPVTMATSMAPVCTVRDGRSGGPTAFENNYQAKPWVITASDTKRFQVNLDNPASFALYFWAARVG